MQVPVKSLDLTPARKLIIISVFITVLGSVMLLLNQRMKLEKALSSYLYEDNLDALCLLQDNAKVIYNTRELLFRYAKVLYIKEDYEKCIPIMQEAISACPTTEKYIDLGNCYQNTNRMKEAEFSFKYASKLLPNLVYPRYCLFALYRDTNRKKEACGIAKQISAMPQIESDASIVKNIKIEISYFIDSK